MRKWIIGTTSAPSPPVALIATRLFAERATAAQPMRGWRAMSAAISTRSYRGNPRNVLTLTRPRLRTSQSFSAPAHEREAPRELLGGHRARRGLHDLLRFA